MQSRNGLKGFNLKFSVDRGMYFFSRPTIPGWQLLPAKFASCCWFHSSHCPYWCISGSINFVQFWIERNPLTGLWQENHKNFVGFFPSRDRVWNKCVRSFSLFGCRFFLEFKLTTILICSLLKMASCHAKRGSNPELFLRLSPSKATKKNGIEYCNWHLPFFLLWICCCIADIKKFTNRQICVGRKQCCIVCLIAFSENPCLFLCVQ